MPRRTERLPLPGQAPGTARSVTIHRYGAAGARPKAYVQAALHADETPALLVQHHLTRLLDAADAAGEVAGEIVIVPYANPIGLAQVLNAHHMGRHELGGASNFNRNWPDVFEPVAEEMVEVQTREFWIHRTLSIDGGEQLDPTRSQVTGSQYFVARRGPNWRVEGWDFEGPEAPPARSPEPSPNVSEPSTEGG